MVELLVPAAVSFGLALALTPAIRSLALHLRLVDNPDGRRKLHGRSTPVAGGPILLLSVGPALLLAFLWPGSPLAQAEVIGDHILGLLPAALVICSVGILDDLGRLRGRHKLAGQLLAVSIVVACGARIDRMRLFDADFDLGLLSIPFTLFFLLGAINSLNLIDGMDGLLTSVSLITCVSFGCVAILGGKDATACVAFALASALLAFLWFNFPPASIFLGDSGSMLIGLTLGVVAIDSSLKRPATIALATPAALLALPILDTLAAILRRKLTGRSIYSTDRGHLHHCLLRRLVQPRRVLLVVSACCVALGAGVVSGQVLGSEVLIVASGFVVVVMLIATRLFGHTELLLASQRLGSILRSLLRVLPAGEARQSEMRLQGTADWRELWLRITASAASLNLFHVRLDVNAPALGEGYHARWDRAHLLPEDEGGVWHASIPLAMGGHVIGELDIRGWHDERPMEHKIGSLACLLREFEFADAKGFAAAPVPVVSEPRRSHAPVRSASGWEETQLERAKL
jgi:UDP-GlcNAc:undecaprenyl-phosphate GlcNAc-1-phosphate transferase